MSLAPLTSRTAARNGDNLRTANEEGACKANTLPL